MVAALSDDARYLRMYRHRPSIWYKHHFDQPLFHYRDRSVLEAFLERSRRRYLEAARARGVEPDPHEIPHRWAWERLQAGELELDARRSYQAEALDEIARPIREGKREFVHRIAFKWANGTTKTTIAALATHWCLDCFPGSKVLTTAGTWSQLREQLWREINTWRDRAVAPIVAQTVDPNKTQIDVASDWMAVGRAAKSEATFEGIHAPVVMVIVDEAKAVRLDVIENAIRRITRGRGRFFVILLSSPGSPSGYFYDVCRGAQSERWTVMSLSAYESEAIPLAQIDDDLQEMSQDAPLFVAIDLGEFPTEGGANVIPLSYVLAAVNRPVAGWDPEDGFAPGFEFPWRTAGCDVARRGDDETAIADLLGRRVSLRDFWATFRRTNFISGRIHDLWIAHDYEAIGVDDTGAGGGVSDDLAALELPLVEINFGEVARRFPEKYHNLKSEIWFFLRAELEAGFLDWDNPDVGLSLPPDRRLQHQLTCVEFDYDETQRRWVEGHKAIVARGEKSPDRADAVAIANYVRGEAVEHSLEALPNVMP